MGLDFLFILFNSMIVCSFIIFLNLFSLLLFLFFLSFQNHQLINDFMQLFFCFLLVLNLFKFEKRGQRHLLMALYHFIFSGENLFFEQIRVFVLFFNLNHFLILDLNSLCFLNLLITLKLILLINPHFFLNFHHLLFYFQFTLHFQQNHLFHLILDFHSNFQCLQIRFLNFFLQFLHQFQVITNYLPIFLINLFDLQKVKHHLFF